MLRECPRIEELKLEKEEESKHAVEELSNNLNREEITRTRRRLRDNRHFEPLPEGADYNTIWRHHMTALEFHGNDNGLKAHMFMLFLQVLT